MVGTTIPDVTQTNLKQQKPNQQLVKTTNIHKTKQNESKIRKQIESSAAPGVKKYGMLTLMTQYTAVRSEFTYNRRRWLLCLGLFCLLV